MDKDGQMLVERGRLSSMVGVAAARSRRRTLRGPVSPEEVSGYFGGGLLSSECLMEVSWVFNYRTTACFSISERKWRLEMA